MCCLTKANEKLINLGMKDFKLPDETVGTVIREKVKYCE